MYRKRNASCIRMWTPQTKVLCHQVSASCTHLFVCLPKYQVHGNNCLLLQEGVEQHYRCCAPVLPMLNSMHWPSVDVDARKVPQGLQATAVTLLLWHFLIRRADQQLFLCAQPGGLCNTM